MNKILLPIYLLLALSLFLYSFTQIDLSLLFTGSPLLQSIQKNFQYIGYFNRPYSALLYITIILTMFITYVYAIRLALQKKLTTKYVWTLILVITTLLAFSYNAFSYDLFNYIFDAKIVTYYHENPYIHKALDFPGDPMLSFMRWTHRTYPYGPVWLGLTIPLSYLGLQNFIATFILFKALMVASFLGSVLMIGKILRKISPKDEVFGLIFFGLNPLIIVESLVSAHVDIVMIFLSLLAVYLLIGQKYITSWFMLLLSIGIKFASIFLLPVFVLKPFFDKKGKLTWDQIFYASAILMAVSVVIASIVSGNFQPWYLIGFLAFATFIAKRPIIFIAAFIGSFVGLLNYVPYLLLGVWDTRVPELTGQINIVGLTLIIVCSVGFLLTRPRKVQ
jgi:hypothetical protein